MRLIDADKLKSALKVPMISSLGKPYIDYEFTLNRIDNTPTVEAIPIEFIQEVISDYQLADQWNSAYALDMLIGYWKAEKGEG